MRSDSRSIQSSTGKPIPRRVELLAQDAISTWK